MYMYDQKHVINQIIYSSSFFIQISTNIYLEEEKITFFGGGQNLGVE